MEDNTERTESKNQQQLRKNRKENSNNKEKVSLYRLNKRQKMKLLHHIRHEIMTYMLEDM